MNKQQQQNKTKPQPQKEKLTPAFKMTPPTFLLIIQPQ